MRLNLGCGHHPIEGFQNHDPVVDGWRFEDGLPQYGDNSVEGITICHALMYLPVGAWPEAFREFARVLEPGGILRVQEDWTDNPDSERFGGYPGGVTITTPALVELHMLSAGLVPEVVTYDTTLFHDSSLIQKLHGGEPKTFVVDGCKPSV